MTAIYDTSAPHSLPMDVRVLGGSRWMTRAAQSFFGTALILAAFGLWLEPGARFDADLMLFKLGLSALFGLTGMALLRSGHEPHAAEVEIDAPRGELRLMRRRGARRHVVHAMPLTALGRVERTSHMVRLWDDEGTFIAELGLSDPGVRDVLMSALKQANKL